MPAESTRSARRSIRQGDAQGCDVRRHAGTPVRTPAMAVLREVGQLQASSYDRLADREEPPDRCASRPSTWRTCSSEGVQPGDVGGGRADPQRFRRVQRADRAGELHRCQQEQDAPSLPHFRLAKLHTRTERVTPRSACLPMDWWSEPAATPCPRSEGNPSRRNCPRSLVFPRARELLTGTH